MLELLSWGNVYSCMERGWGGDVRGSLVSAEGLAARRGWRSGVVSAGVHLVVLVVVVGGWPGRARLMPNKLPGTAQGVRLLTYYAAGSPAHAVSDMAAKKPAERKAADVLHKQLSLPMPEQPAAPFTEEGKGSQSDSGLGQGDIRIALQVVFPYPKIDVSSLPHGTKADVVLNAVIDEHGKIADLTLLKGMGAPVDDVVIATVKQWTFTPATRNGVPISSEQELHFHYERS